MKKLLRAIGMSGVSVDTVLRRSTVRPGEFLEGDVRITAESAAAIENVSLALVTRVELDGAQSHGSDMEFGYIDVAGAFSMAAGEEKSIGFQLPVPWEAPITTMYGQHLRGMAVGVRTDVAIAKAIDKGDLDAVFIEPLPAQVAILEAFAELGFRFKHADVERGQIAGVHQTLPFFQEIEFFPPSYAGSIGEVEVTFIAGPRGMAVVCEVDKRGGYFTPGGDTYFRLDVEYAALGRRNWAAEIDQWIRHASESMSRRGHYGRQGHHGGGMGSMVGGAAAGFVGGMVIGEVMDDMFE